VRDKSRTDVLIEQIRLEDAPARVPREPVIDEPRMDRVVDQSPGPLL
jgi:hypothetical protein